MNGEDGVRTAWIGRRTRAAATTAAGEPVRKPRRDIRVLFFTGNRGRATHGAEPIAGRTGPPGHSTRAWPFRPLEIEPA